MKLLSFLILFSLAFGKLCIGAENTTTNHWGMVTNNAQLSIDLENKNVITTNEVVKLLVRVRNLSTNETVKFHDAIVQPNDPVVGVGLTVVSPSGKVIARPGRDYRGGSGRLVSVRAKQTVEFELDLSRIVRFEEVGIYTITARKTIGSGLECQNSLEKSP